MSIPILIVGTGFDGPVDTPTKVTSFEQAFSLFGGYAYERFTLSPQTTGCALSMSPEGGVSVYTEDGVDLETYDLFNLEIGEDGAITFDAPGSQVDVIFRYIRPIADYPTALYKAFAEVNSTQGIEVYMMRSGGSTSTLSVTATGGSLTLESTYCGSRYNDAVVKVCSVSSPSTPNENVLALQLIPPAGRGTTRTYYLESAPGVPKLAHDVAAAINLDNAKGYVLYTAEGTGSSLARASGTTIVSNGDGTDGTMTSADIANILDTSDITGVKVVHFAGTYFEDIQAILTEDFFDNLVYPTAIVQAMKPSSVSMTNSAYADSLVALTQLNNWITDVSLSLVVGDGYYNYGSISPYYDSLAPVYAAILSSSTSGTTLKAAGVERCSPCFDEESITALAEAGFVTFTRCISKGIAVYRGVTSVPQWGATTFLAYSAVATKLADLVEPLVGYTEVDETEFEASIEEALSEIELIRLYDFDVEYNTSEINVLINMVVVGEVQKIQFGIGVSTGATVYNSA